MSTNKLYCEEIIASKTKAPAKFLSAQARRLAMGGESFGGNVEPYVAAKLLIDVAYQFSFDLIST